MLMLFLYVLPSSEAVVAAPEPGGLAQAVPAAAAVTCEARVGVVVDGGGGE